MTDGTTTTTMHSRLRYLGLLSAAGLILLVLPSSASAQATRTWVSGVGDDANPCSRTAPCKTFAGSISKTAAKGEINCLDPGGFGGVTITKAIKIRCQHTEAGVLVSGTNAIVVNAAATDSVILRGLDIHGTGTGLNGIRVLQAERVKVYDTEISGFARNGVDFEPANSGAKGLVRSSTIEDNGGNGVLVAPPDPGDRVRMTVRHSDLSSNGCGITATSHSLSPTFDYAANCGTLTTGSAGAPKVGLFYNAIMDHDDVAGAAGSTGAFSNGPQATIQIGGNEITGNTNGIRSIDVGLNGIFSFGDNYIYGNTTNGTPDGTISPT